MESFNLLVYDGETNNKVSLLVNSFDLVSVVTSCLNSGYQITILRKDWLWSLQIVILKVVVNILLNVGSVTILT